MDTIGNMNYAFIKYGNWIVDSNYKKAPPLKK